MYPDEIFLGMTLYDIFILIGVIAAFILADKMTVKLGFSIELQRIVIVCALSCVIVGYASAVLFQAFYNIAERGKFVIDKNTGATFYGGLIGGTITFLLIYFLAGRHFCKDKREAVRRFPEMGNIGACCVPLAHAFGRIGCLMAGCCYGRETDAWYGIAMKFGDVTQKVVPIQLYESLFLFALAAVTILLFYKNTGKHKFPLLPFYCLLYGVWRFCIEYARADYRGTTIVSFLTPSQLVAVLLIIVGIVYFSVWGYKRKKAMKAEQANV
jgi:phosphatidylglycerol:prolipoprotein diacylglycerol transferase